jgi:hypothetical protein
LLIAAGRHRKEIQARIGHQKIVLTFDRYGHRPASLGDGLADALDAADEGAEVRESETVRLRLRESGAGARP